MKFKIIHIKVSDVKNGLYLGSGVIRLGIDYSVLNETKRYE